MNPNEEAHFAAKATDALSLLAQNVGKVAANLGRLGAAVEQANVIAEKHNQWERREDG